MALKLSLLGLVYGSLIASVLSTSPGSIPLPEFSYLLGSIPKEKIVGPSVPPQLPTQLENFKLTVHFYTVSQEAFPHEQYETAIKAALADAGTIDQVGLLYEVLPEGTEATQVPTVIQVSKRDWLAAQIVKRKLLQEQLEVFELKTFGPGHTVEGKEYMQSALTKAQQQRRKMIQPISYSPIPQCASIPYESGCPCQNGNDCVDGTCSFSTTAPGKYCGATGGGLGNSPPPSGPCATFPYATGCPCGKSKDCSTDKCSLNPSTNTYTCGGADLPGTSPSPSPSPTPSPSPPPPSCNVAPFPGSCPCSNGKQCQSGVCNKTTKTCDAVIVASSPPPTTITESPPPATTTASPPPVSAGGFASPPPPPTTTTQSPPPPPSTILESPPPAPSCTVSPYPGGCPCTGNGVCASQKCNKVTKTCDPVIVAPVVNTATPTTTTTVSPPPPRVLLQDSPPPTPKLKSPPPPTEMPSPPPPRPRPSPPPPPPPTPPPPRPSPAKLLVRPPPPTLQI